jgi:hypothetical protein
VKTSEEIASDFADTMIRNRGTPHRNDLVDAYLAGREAASKPLPVDGRRSAREIANKVIELWRIPEKNIKFLIIDAIERDREECPCRLGIG